MVDLACVESASGDPRIPDGTTVPRAFSQEAGRSWIARQHGRRESGHGWSLAVGDADTGSALGCATLLLRPQEGVAGIGYWLVPGARGRGLASRAVRLLAEWGLRERGLARVEAWVEPDNAASVAVLIRCGFEHEGRLRSFLSFPSRRCDALVLSRLADAGDGQPRR
jgi:RimJ/RimL family protein N-acetyltransferase